MVPGAGEHMRRNFSWKLVGISAALLAVACGGGGGPRTGSGTPDGGQTGQPRASGTGLQGEYFDSATLTNSVLVRVDPRIDFDWSAGPPAGVPLTTAAFSVRWTGQVEALASGDHTFALVSSSGARLWINGQLLVDGWTGNAGTRLTGVVQLTAKQRYDVRVEYHEDGATGASIHLSWAYPGQSEQVVPTTQLFPGASPDALVPSTIDQTVTNSMPDTTAFIYSGAHPVQTGVDAGTILKERVTIIRGRVVGPNGLAAPGVLITVLGHPEFGQTFSRSDGAYDLAVNGGPPATIVFSLPGFLPLHRQVPTPWRDYSFVPDVVLTPFDDVVTPITANGGGGQVARGSPVTDTSGTRQATVLFPAGTTATMTLPGGGVQSLSTLHVRATEYTVGNTGPQAMPASLPPRSGYTYAVELSVDEAVAEGAERIDFNQPVPFYVENFLHFPVGSPVPVGSYDRTLGLWKAEPNGLVVKVLGVAGGLATLDVDGSGQAANAAQLAFLGISDAERGQLGALYPTGSPALWRVAMTHFTVWDCNWPYGPPYDAVFPSERPEGPDNDPNCKTTKGSIIECENMVLREQLPLVGTNQFLAYRSDRVAGRTAEYSTLIHLVPLPPKRVPASIGAIIVEVIGGGQHKVWEWFQNQYGGAGWPGALLYTWDGKDAYGREVNGPQSFRIRVGYVYGAIYQAVFGGGAGQGGASFGQASGQQAVGDQTRNTITLWAEWEVTLGTVRHLAAGLGGWSLSDHHTFDPDFGMLIRGDGARVPAVSTAPVLTGVVGGACLGCGARPVDGGPALNILFDSVPAGAAVAPDGTLVFMAGRQIWRVLPNSTLSLVAGDGASVADPPPFYGDGQPARSVTLPQSISGLAITPDGTIYFTQLNGSLVRKVSPEGILSTVAGNNGPPRDSGDNGPALQASLFFPVTVAVDADGNLYIGEFGGRTVRRVDGNGIITTVAGNGQLGPASDEGLKPTSTPIGAVKHVAVDQTTGALYVVSTDNVIWQFDANGRSKVVFGGIPPVSTPQGFTTDGQLARGASTQAGIEGITVLRDGRLAFSETGNLRLRMIDSDGTLLTLAGNGDAGRGYSGAPATGVTFTPWLVTVAPDGALFTFGNSNNEYGYRLAPVHAGFSAAQRIVGSSDGAEAYIFDSGGRHQQTVDALSGSVLRTFNYDTQGRLATVIDGDGNTLILHRDGSGNLTGIDAPFGQHTAVTVDGNGYLASITNPASERASLQSSAGGLLTSLTDPKQQQHVFQYDSLGRLTKDTNAAGGFKQLDRTRVGSDSLEVDVTTALGRRTVHRVLSPGSTFVTRTVIQPDGTQEVTTENGSSFRTIQAADGSTTTVNFASDGRFGVSSPLPFWTFRTPSGLVASGSTTRSPVLSVPGDPLSLTSLTTMTTINASAWLESFDVPTRTRTLRSPLGKVSSQVLDTRGRVVKSSVPGLADITYTYDPNGRLQTIQQGTRTVSLTFGSDGLAATSTDALNRVTAYTRDPAGRVRTSQLPGSRVVAFVYDQNGNLTSLSPPGQPAHLLTYGPQDEETQYVPPVVISPPASPIGTRSTGYGYDLDGALTAVSGPDGTNIVTSYDPAGRLKTVQTSRTTVQMQYSPDAGQLVGMVDALASGPNPSTSSLSLAYDGALVTGTTWSGAVNGSVLYTYTSDLQVATSTVSGTPTVTNTFDLDLLLSSVAIATSPATTLTVSRNSQNGFLTGTSVGVVSTSQAFDSYGSTTSLSASAGGTALYSTSLTHDPAGRVKQKVEIVQGVSHTYLYSYDDADQLTDVSIDGVAAGHWEYDANGNRTGGTSSNDTGVALTGTYDAQDRLISYGSAQYVFGPRGDLRSKTVSGKTTTYSYDELGALVSVALEDGTRIDYVVDATGRRVGKKLNGALDRGWLYEGMRPVAEIDGTGAVVARFVYATRPHVPDMIWKAGVLYRLITDELGSVRLVVDSSTGVVAQRLDYDAWGNVVNDTSPGFQPFGYAGGLWDPLTRLTRYGARDYDAETGRWTNKDPARFMGGDTNLFAYARNDPVNHLDTTGLVIDVAPNVSDTTRLAIRRFRSDPCGAELWRQLEQSPLTFIIKEEELERGNRFTGRVPVPGKTTISYVFIDDYERRLGGAIIKMDWTANERAGGYPWYQPRTITEALAHEFFHASGLLGSDHLNDNEGGANDFGRKFRYLDVPP
jgi:RHS repeat-associated protein